MGISVYPPASTGAVAKTLKQKVFNTSGTWTYPSSSNFDGTVELTVVAGGGAGGACLNRSGSSRMLGAGAGGGGQVVLRKQLSVLGAGNQTVTVGAGGGGYTEAGGLFGHISSFGSGYIRNLYPDPALTKGLMFWNASVGTIYYPETRNSASNIDYAQPYVWVSGTNPPQPPVGRTYVQLNLNGNSGVHSQFVSVKGSTSYRIIFSHTFYIGGGITVSPSVLWYDSTGQAISSDSLTSFTTQSSSGTWAAVTSTVTSPSTAAYARLTWVPNSGASWLLTGIQFAETAANVTSVVHGGVSGYAWTGVPDSSYTVEENERLVAAQGGGGGWGVAFRASNSGAGFLLPGHAGYTAGGFGMNTSSSGINAGELLIVGSGGGANGNALSQLSPTQPASTATYTINDGGSHSSRYGFSTDSGTTDSRFHAAIHTSAAYVGSESSWLSASINNSVFPFTSFGENGKGIEGYGYGGIGYARSSNSTYNTSFKASAVTHPGTLAGYTNDWDATQPIYQAAWNGRANTGNGGNGWITSVSSGVYSGWSGPRGGSGVVIVRWYE